MPQDSNPDKELRHLLSNNFNECKLEEAQTLPSQKTTPYILIQTQCGSLLNVNFKFRTYHQFLGLAKIHRSGNGNRLH